MFPQISFLKLKFQKAETWFCRWKSTDNNSINIFVSVENPCIFLLAKEKTWECIFNTNSELLQNHAEKQIMPSKTTVNWLFNDIWCYLFIGCFDWKIGIFQQTVVRVYYIPLNGKLQKETIIYYFIYYGARKVFCKIMQQKYFKEVWFVLWYRSVSCWGIIVICNTKFLNKYNKLWHFAECLGKSFPMQINWKSFTSV